MDLYSPKDKNLLKNCIVVKLKQLELEKTKPNADFLSIKNEISYYENLYQILKADDTDTLILTLTNTISEKNYIEFNKHILSSSSKDIATEYVKLTKSLMIENNAYSDEKFEELKRAFYKGNENLLEIDKTKDPHKMEEEPSLESSQNNLTEEEKDYMAQIEMLFKQSNPKTMSPEQFNEFSEQFKNLIKLLGLSKFQQFFNEQNKTITDMQISYNVSEFPRHTYVTTFSLLDSENKPSQETIRETAPISGFTSTYYPTLCRTYLLANNSTRITESNEIQSKINTFHEMYKKIKDMTPKFKIKIANHSIFYIDESNYEPTKDELDIACNNSISSHDSPDKEITI